MTGQVVLVNNVSTTLKTAITTGSSSLVVAAGTGVLFPTLTNSDYCYVTIASTANAVEIVKMTAKSGDTLTVTRAQEGTTARAFAAGSKVEIRVTAQSVVDAVTAGVESIPTLRSFGASGDGVSDDTAFITLAMGIPGGVDGEGRTYGVTGALALTANTHFHDATFRQLAPYASQSVITLSATGVDGINLTRISVDRNGTGANSGTNAPPNAALSTAFGIKISGGQYHHLQDVRVYGNDSGTGIYLVDLDKTSKIIRPNVSNMMAVVAGATDDCVQGILLNTCDGLVIDHPVVQRLGWRDAIGDATTYTNSRCIVLSGCSNIDIVNSNIEAAAQGIDFSGDLGSGNHDCNVWGGRAKNMVYFGLKYSNISYRIRAFGFIADTCGYNGFVDSSTFDIMPTADYKNSVVDCVAINCDNTGTGSKGGFSRLPGSRTYKNSLDIVRCVSIDNRVGPTMRWGFQSEIDAALYTVRCIDCFSIGHTVAAFGSTIVQHGTGELGYVSGRAMGTMTSAAYVDNFELNRVWFSLAGVGTATRTLDLTALSSRYVLAFSATNAIRFESPDFIPFDPSMTYRVQVRLRKNSGTTGNYSIGVIGYKADRVTRVSTAGTDTYASAHNAVAAGTAQSTLSSSWSVVTGYIAGTSAAPSGGAGTSGSPAPLHENIRFFRLYAVFNNATGNGLIDVDSVIITAVLT